jgi:hypothetical protein
MGYGWFYALQGKFDAAADHFEKAIESRDPNAIWIASEPVLDRFRASNRGQRVLQKMNLARPAPQNFARRPL